MDAEFTPRRNILSFLHPAGAALRTVIFGRMPATPKLQALARLIGATPLLEIHCRYRGHEHRIYAKHEE